MTDSSSAAPGSLCLLIGPVGAGKTTLGRRLAAQQPAVFLDLDTWMVRFFGDDARPPTDVMGWYLERRARCVGGLWSIAAEVASVGTHVVLELGLVLATERLATYEKARLEALPLTIRLVDAPREIRRERVARRNADTGAFTQVVPAEMFELASDAWEPPSESERNTWGILDA